jgi:uncharacterized protein (TIGR02611 family)
MQQVNQKTGLARRVLVTVAGVTLCVLGIALLVLPGPGLLLVLAGLVLLANEYPWARRMTGPVRKRATQAAEQSIASPVRISATALCGLALIGAGLAWILVPALPLGGVATGSSLILSGIVVLVLLVYSYRRFRHGSNKPRGDQERTTMN